MLININLLIIIIYVTNFKKYILKSIYLKLSIFKIKSNYILCL